MNSVRSQSDDAPTRERVATRLAGTLFTPERYCFHASLDSTNREAARLAEDGAPEGTVVVADHQTSGKGRMGRTWASPPGSHLYFSVVLRPDLEARHAAQLTLLAGLALAEAVAERIRETAPGPTRGLELKWPNDLLLDGRKLAGVLTEMRTDGNRVRHVVVGIGLNVHGRAADLSPDLETAAVTLAEHLRADLNRSSLLVGMLSSLEKNYRLYLTQGFSPIRKGWLTHSRVIGGRVRINLASESYEGYGVDLDAEGFLLVARDDGSRTRVLAGDVHLIRDPAE